MHPSIRTVNDSQRGCGWRKMHGLYLRTDTAGIPCSVLPLELKPCETCAAMGLRCKTSFSRGYTWINPSKLFDWKNISCGRNSGLCPNCSMNIVARSERSGLLWVGRKFYKTPTEFTQEANRLGISRRLPADHLPRNFKVGEDIILLAHEAALTRPGMSKDGKMFVDVPGVFMVFRPDRIECVVNGTESDDYINGLVERGITPVIINRNNS